MAKLRRNAQSIGKVNDDVFLARVVSVDADRCLLSGLQRFGDWCKNRRPEPAGRGQIAHVGLQMKGQQAVRNVGIQTGLSIGSGSRPIAGLRK